MTLESPIKMKSENMSSTANSVTYRLQRISLVRKICFVFALFFFDENNRMLFFIES